MAGRGDTRIELLRVIGALSVFSYHLMGDAETVLRPTFASGQVWAAIREGSGPFGVGIFIVISGIVFTWSWPRADGSADFVRRRLRSIFPIFWWVAVPMVLAALAAHMMSPADLWKVPIWLSGLGIVSPTTFFPVVDGWWYMTLALQLVLAYPMLRRAQDGLGAEAFVLVSAVATVASVWALRALGWDYAVGGFVGSRLLEFAIGMTIAKYVGAGIRGWPRATALAAMVVALAACAAVQGGVPLRIALAPAVVCLTVGAVGNLPGSLGRWVAAAGSLSFAFYLSHSPWAKPILAFMTREASSTVAIALGGVLAFAVAGLVALGFQRSFLWANGLRKGKSSEGPAVGL
jgi:peptidoglycan/LPS O-acetylase OafA/YrhL